MTDTKHTGTLEHRIDISGGHDLRRDNPSQNYGISACRIFFYVIGPKGAVQFVIGTDWYPESARQHLRRVRRLHPEFSDSEERGRYKPEGWDVGYHAHEPQYENQTAMDGECHILGGKCYHDGSSLYADSWIEGFVNGGTEWLWPRLEQEYRSRFEGGAAPDLTPVLKKHPKEREAAALAKSGAAS